MGKCADLGQAMRRITGQVIVDIIIWLIVGISSIYLFLAGVPNHRGFFCDDSSISYPHKPETISTNLLVLIGMSTSIAVVVIVEILNSLESKCLAPSASSESIVYIIKCYSVFLVGFSINQIFVEIIKNETGELRPNFLDVCKPEYNRSLCPGFIKEYTCTGTESGDVLRRSRQSFPSGHSAFTMFIAVYFCLYVHHRLHITFSRVLKCVIQSSLMLASTVCGFRRITDHKHHTIDVISGFILGGSIATLVYKSLAESIMTSHGHERMSIKDQSEACFTCGASGIDYTSPTPLLTVEFNHRDENGYSRAHAFKDTKFGIRNTMPDADTALASIDV